MQLWEHHFLMVLYRNSSMWASKSFPYGINSYSCSRYLFSCFPRMSYPCIRKVQLLFFLEVGNHGTSIHSLFKRSKRYSNIVIIISIVNVIIILFGSRCCFYYIHLTSAKCDSIILCKWHVEMKKDWHFYLLRARKNGQRDNLLSILSIYICISDTTDATLRYDISSHSYSHSSLILRI